MNRKTFLVGAAGALGALFYGTNAARAAANDSKHQMNLPNLTFQDGTAHWELRGGAAETETYQLAQTPEGKPALSLKIADSSPAFLQKSTFAGRKDFPAEAGYYLLRFQMQTALTSGFAYPQIFAQLNDRSHIMLASLDDSGLRRISGQTPWTDYWLIYQVPENVSAVYAWFKADLAKGEVSLGDVQIEKMNSAQAKVLLSQIDGMVATHSDKYLLYKDDFINDQQWSAEGKGKHWLADGKLFMDCLTNGQESTPGMTLWLKPELSGDIYISYETMVLEPENWNNLNFFLMGRALDGRRASEAGFNGDYGQYHKEAKTYIGTLTYKWSRMRRDPGFHVISEDFNTTGEVNQKYFFEITKRGKILEWRINGKLVHHAEDDDPYNSGQFALRSAGTFSWVRNLRIYQYV
jgi:hypothetical protein